MGLMARVCLSLSWPFWCVYFLRHLICRGHSTNSWISLRRNDPLVAVCSYFNFLEPNWLLITEIKMTQWCMCICGRRGSQEPPPHPLGDVTPTAQLVLGISILPSQQVYQVISLVAMGCHGQLHEELHTSVYFWHYFLLWLCIRLILCHYPNF